MANYIDGFALPISKEHLVAYKEVAETIAGIWKEYGALAYSEYVADDLSMEGTLSFPTCLNAKENETIIFGWVAFESREARDLANKRVASDNRIADLMAPLLDPDRVIFDASRMAYAGFQSFISV